MAEGVKGSSLVARAIGVIVIDAIEIPSRQAQAATLAPLLHERRSLGVGVHDGLSALVAARHDFGFLWISSFGVSAASGLPDAGLIEGETRARLVARIHEIVDLALVVDMDAASDDPVKTFREVRQLIGAGAAAVCIEDVVQRKRSSLYDGHARELASLDEHLTRIQAAAQAFQASGAPSGVIARTEALVSGHGLEEAVLRARESLEAGADAIFVQSLDSTGEEAREFCREMAGRSAIFLAPTRYGSVPREGLYEEGATHLIFANQAIRAAHQAMDAVFARLGASDLCSVDDGISPVSSVAREVGAETLLSFESRLAVDSRRRSLPMPEVEPALEEAQRYVDASRASWSLENDVDMDTFNHLARVWVQRGVVQGHLDELLRLVAFQHEDGGWGDRRDDPVSRTRTSAFSCQVLLRARRAVQNPALSAAVDRGLEMLLDRQEEDGRWADDRWPFLDATSVSVGTLLFAVREPDDSMEGIGARRAAVERGMNFVLEQRHEDGLWYHKPTASPVEITAHLLQKCAIYGVDREILQSSARSLLELQATDGSWDNQSTDATCDVVRCLMLAAEQENGVEMRPEIDAACKRAMRWLLSVSDRGRVGVRPGRPASVLYTCDLIDTALKYQAHQSTGLAEFYQ